MDFLALIERKRVTNPLAISLFQFLNRVDDLYGTYLDAIQGFHNNRKELLRIHEILRLEGTLPPNILDVQYSYGSGSPDAPEHRLQHVSTQREFLERNDSSARNSTIMGHLIIIQIFGLWEDEYREGIAKEFDMKKNDFKQDVFGDLRTLRNSIVHNNGVATSDVEKNQIFNWFKRGDHLVFKQEHIEEIVNYVRGFNLIILEKINPFTPSEELKY
jgi:hypothetical protein